MTVKTHMINNVIDDDDFRLFVKLMYDSAGIFINQTKKNLVSNRLRKRIAELNLSSYNQYYNYCLKNYDEKIQCIEALTTNETYFYREPKHWEFLINKIIPEKFESDKNKITKHFKIWSCASSTGEEPYTLALILKEFLPDINEKVLAAAQNGVYSYKRIDKLSPVWISKYFIKNGDNYKLKDEIKKMVQFKKFNLFTDTNKEKYDLILCRNVLIYFDENSKTKVIKTIKNCLNSNSYFFLGHSEGIVNMDKELKFIQPSVYKLVQD